MPRDYDNPNGGKFTLRVAKAPATDQQHRIGSLFMNFGGPGAPMAIYVEVFGADLFSELNRRFDIIGVDPRGVGESQPSIDCKANQETQGIYSEPFPTPFTANQNQLIAKDNRYIAKCLQNNQGVLQYVSTANVARDFDAVRAALGEQKLNYFGFSYGTFGEAVAQLVGRSFTTTQGALLDVIVPPDAGGKVDLTVTAPGGRVAKYSAGFKVVPTLDLAASTLAGKPGDVVDLVTTGVSGAVLTDVSVSIGGTKAAQPTITAETLHVTVPTVPTAPADLVLTTPGGATPSATFDVTA